MMILLREGPVEGRGVTTYTLTNMKQDFSDAETSAEIVIRQSW
jgi:hypothetical protein